MPEECRHDCRRQPGNRQVELTPELLRVMIAEHLRGEWLGSDPGPDCFDASEANMDGLLRFLRGETMEAVRKHLLACSRCRYLYSVIRKSGRGRQESS